MEIAVGLLILAVIGIAILGSVGLVCYLIWRMIRRNKTQSRRNFNGDSDDSTSFDDYSYSTYHSNSNVIVPATGTVAASELVSNYESSSGESVGGSWDYTDYTDSGSGSDSSSSDGGSSDSGSSSSSCSSCGGSSSSD